MHAGDMERKHVSEIKTENVLKSTFFRLDAI